MKHCILIFCIFLLPSTVYSDIGPSSYNGLSIVPAENTEVSMNEETVDIFVRNDGNAVPYRYLCDVKAEFIMENKSGRNIEILVGFPVEPYMGKLDLFARSVMVKDDIYNFKVFSNGVPVDSISASVVNGNFGRGRADDYLWYGWIQRFNPGTTKILIEYSFTTTPIIGFNATKLGYSLYSGSFWKGPIGKAVISVYFPRVMTEEFLKGISPEGYIIEDKKIVWKLENYEPYKDDNLHLEFIPFDLIDKIETSRTVLAAHSTDLGAKIDLAEAYLNTLRNSRKTFKYRKRFSAWDDSLYMREAEKQILETLDKRPDDCYVWNLYLSHYFKIHDDAFNPFNPHPDSELSDDQKSAIDQAFVHCPADSGIVLWKVLLDGVGPDFYDKVKMIEEAGSHITVWTSVPGERRGTAGRSIKPYERDILYLMFQPIDTMFSEVYVKHNTKAEKREIRLQPRKEIIPDDVREMIVKILGWDYKLRGFNARKIREYNERNGVYPEQ